MTPGLQITERMEKHPCLDGPECISILVLPEAVLKLLNLQVQIHKTCIVKASKRHVSSFKKYCCMAILTTRRQLWIQIFQIKSRSQLPAIQKGHAILLISPNTYQDSTIYSHSQSQRLSILPISSHFICFLSPLHHIGGADTGTRTGLLPMAIHARHLIIHQQYPTKYSGIQLAEGFQQATFNNIISKIRIGETV